MSTDAATIKKMAASPAVFQAELVIPGAHGPRRFADCMADFQRERFAQINPALISLARGEKPDIGRFWWEATKGASKDSDLTICLLWLLAFTSRPLLVQIGAADKDQAGEMRKAAKAILRLNPWLEKRITINNWQILCEATDSIVEIIASDVGGSHGARPDVLICNELSHITKQEFAENLMDNAAKVPFGLVVIATNAGFSGTWQYQWREQARKSDRWTFNKIDTPAPWLDEADILEAQVRNSASRFNRLWRGVWASGSGDALDPELIKAAVDESLPPMTGRESDFAFLGGLDLGIRRDHSALLVLGVHRQTGRFRLAHCQSWRPPKGGEVDLEAVEQAVIETHARYKMQAVAFDPFQALLMAQRLRKKSIPMLEVTFSGANLNKMASKLLDTFNARAIELYDCPQLIHDLSRLMIVEKSYGYKLESTRDSSGHADTATALALALFIRDKITIIAGSWGGSITASEVRIRRPTGARVPW